MTSDLFKYGLVTLILLLIELLYFKTAKHYFIIDKPNDRSSHKSNTIRGGGLIFPISILIWFFLFNKYPLFIAGLIIISLISFLDDIKSISNSSRLIIHLSAVSFIFISLQIFEFNVLLIFLIYILLIGIINAYNFMDGINGITGLYSLVVLATLFYINEISLKFIDKELLIFLVLSILIFLFFNFRKIAVCFSGDVGSISLAYIISFLLLIVVLKTGIIYYFLLLSIYGIDTIITIIYRLYIRQNIFTAHRLHLYQLLSNNFGINQIMVALLYSFIQLLFNIILIYLISIGKAYIISIILIIIILIYCFIRFKIVQKAVMN